MITTSNRAWNIVDEYMIDAIVGQYQCFSVVQRFDETIGKLRKTVFFNGNPIASKTYKREDVFTGPLQVWI